MTREEAKRAVEELVFCRFTWGDILYHCEEENIPTKMKSGRYRRRSSLEQALIERYIEKFTTEEEGAVMRDSLIERSMNNDTRG